MDYNQKIEFYLDMIENIKLKGELVDLNYGKSIVLYKYDKNEISFIAMESKKLNYHYIYIRNKDYECSCINGPALIKFDNYTLQEWYYVEDTLHRLDGPALIVYKDGKVYEEQYFINGKEYSEFEFLVAREVFK